MDMIIALLFYYVGVTNVLDFHRVSACEAIQRARYQKQHVPLSIGHVCNAPILCQKGQLNIKKLPSIPFRSVVTDFVAKRRYKFQQIQAVTRVSDIQIGYIDTYI